MRQNSSGHMFYGTILSKGNYKKLSAQGDPEDLIPEAGLVYDFLGNDPHIQMYIATVRHAAYMNAPQFLPDELFQWTHEDRNEWNATLHKFFIDYQLDYNWVGSFAPQFKWILGASLS